MSSSIILTFTTLSLSLGGVTFRRIFSDLPTDPASVFAILLLLVALGVVLWFGRTGGQGGQGGRPA